MRKYSPIDCAAMTLVAVLAAGCMQQPQFTPTPTKTPNPIHGVTVLDSPIDTPAPSTSTPTNIPTLSQDAPPITPTATAIPANQATEPTPSITPPWTPSGPTWTPPPPVEDLPDNHYWLQRPIPDEYRNYADRTYPYGATSGGQYRPHHAIDIPNPEGTPVIAVSGGVVTFAGPDSEVNFGPNPYFYGNIIVYQLDPTYNGQPVYVLYAHLSEVYVEAGQRVTLGEVIGTVGSGGVALGPHLHFEVRIGDPYDYNATRNPDLWIRPFYGYGTLTGRVVNQEGAYLYNVTITARGEDMTRYAWTYADTSVNPDDEWRENFTLGDLPEGYYTATVRTSRRYEETVYIHSGQTTWVEIVIDE